MKLFPNGEVYYGGFLEGKFEGEGRYRWPNGDKFKGEWKYGKGKGTMKTSTGVIKNDVTINF